MKRSWRDLIGDTLFMRLFVLMWVALVASHLLAFTVVNQVVSPRGHGIAQDGLRLPPVVPSLPPTGAPPFEKPPPRGGGPPPRATDAAPPGTPLPGAPAAGPPGGRLPGDAPGPFFDPDRAQPDDDRRWIHAQWLDYLIRILGIGVAAWFAARWLSAPMRRLADASEGLGDALLGGRALPRLDAATGTREVRQTARLFNAMAERLRAEFQAQSLLMAAISHDLRTPLARLRLRLETMDEQPQTARCIADVREMDALIGSVLQMMRDKHALGEPERLDLRALLQATVDDLVEHGARVTLRGDDRDDRVASASASASDADADAVAVIVLAQTAPLKRVFGNLIANALRHGGGAAEVTIDKTSASGVAVHVDDRGPGLPPAQLDAVFQPFYRADPARVRDAGGVGLGLYIARDLAQRCGGRLALANRDGGGLRATVTLPRA